MTSHMSRWFGLRISVASVVLSLLAGLGSVPVQAAEPASSVPPPNETNTPKRLARGRVLTPDGEPIEAARIEPYCDVNEVDWVHTQWTFGSRHHEPTTTDEDGIFKYRQPYCDRVGVLVIAPGYARKLVEVPYGKRSIDIVLSKGMTVTGRLLKDGQPVPDIEVGIAQIDRACQTYLEEIIARTDGVGRFVLRDVAPHTAYEIHGKRRSLKLLGVTAEIRVTSGDPETTFDAGDLLVEPGIQLTGRLMLANGEPAAEKSVPIKLADGRTVQSSVGPLQLQIGRDNADDRQWMNLEPDARFTLLAREKEEVYLSAWVSGYELRGPNRYIKVMVRPGMKPIEMVFDPK